jgi:site-specific DNA recombinase
MEHAQAVGVLVRISDDRLGDEKGVARQEADCRKLARRHGWNVAHVYVENDTSAYRRRPVTLHDGSTALRVLRPEYRRLLGDLGSGQLGGLVAYDLDRVARDPRDLEDLIDVIEARGLPTASVTGSLDLSNDAGVFMARMMVNVANKSSRDTSRRVRRKLEENALEGKHHGGSRPYGWQEDRITLDAVEAAVVRQAARRVLDGASIKTIVRELAEAGAVNTVGTPWSDVTIRSMLMRERNAGLRRHQGVVVGEGRWEPILDRQTWEDVRRVLSDPSRVTTPGGRGRVHLLSGIATCGICGAPMRASKGKAYKGVSKSVYRCKGEGQCLSRDLAKVDDVVTRLVLRTLQEPDAAELIRPRDEPGQDLEVEIARVRRRLDEAAEDYAEDRITREQLGTITARLRPKLDELLAQAAPPAPRVGVLDDLARAEDVQAVWDRMDARQRRDVVRELVTIRIMPTTRGPRFDPTKVEITWRTS